jgi:hypothetical protein
MDERWAHEIPWPTYPGALISKINAVANHGVATPIEMSGYSWRTISGEERIRAPWRTRTGEMIWATFEVVEPTTVVDTPTASPARTEEG